MLRENLSENLHGLEKFRRAQLLIADYQHRMIFEGAVKGYVRRCVNRPAQVQPADLGAGVRRRGLKEYENAAWSMGSPGRPTVSPEVLNFNPGPFAAGEWRTTCAACGAVRAIPLRRPRV